MYDLCNMDIRQYFPPKRTRETEAEVDKTSAEDISQATGESSSKSCSQTQGDAAMICYQYHLIPKSSTCQLVRRESSTKLSFHIKESGKPSINGCLAKMLTKVCSVPSARSGGSQHQDQGVVRQARE